MLLLLAVVDRCVPGARQHDVLVDAPPGHTVADLTPRLAAALGHDVVVLHHAGRRLPASLALGAPPLLHGAVVAALPPGSSPSPADPTTEHGHTNASSTAGPDSAPLPGLVRLSLTAGVDAGRTVLLPRGDHVLGRSESANVRLDDRDVSRAHASISVAGGRIRARDLEPTNPSTVDGEPIGAQGSSLERGTRLRVGSAVLELAADVVRPGHRTIQDGRVRVHRPPRLEGPRTAPTVIFPEPPAAPEGHRLPLVASVVPLVASAALALALSSPIMLLFALLSPVMILAQWWGDRRAGRSSHRRRVQEHATATAQAEQQLADAARRDAADRRRAHPDLAVLLDTVRQRGTQLWCRRPGDPDHLVLRVGVADQPAHVPCAGPHPAAPELPCVPAVVDLNRHRVVGVCGRRDDVVRLTGSLLAQVVAWHSPIEVGLLVVAPVPAVGCDSPWHWTRLLPHRVDTSTAANRPTAEAAVLVAEVQRRRQARRDHHRDDVGVDLVVVLDGASDLREEPGVAEALREGPSLGVAFVCLESARPALPGEATAVVEVGRDVSRSRLDVAGEVVERVLPDLPSSPFLSALGREAAPLVDATPRPGATALPRRVGFREVHQAAGVDPLSSASVSAAWLRGERRPVARLGVGADGVHTIDLASDGPHVLVGGTTGSGKSELLQTLVAGLAVSAPPDAVTFLLVDYKGGAAFGPCERLPHVLGVVTDLDEHLTARALESLQAELRRRERVLADAGAKDFAAYERSLPPPGVERLARLVIVVDEFKVLADELPSFVDGLVRVAAVGRSLGVHLVLATQRPAGIVSADMRANLGLRICLRVRDGADSTDVIETTDGATLPASSPGRALLRAGDQRLVAVQTAWLGGPDAEPEAPDLVVTVVPPSGPALPTIDPGASGASEDARTELDAVVDAVRAAGRDAAVSAPATPWLPALPTVVTAASLRVDGLLPPTFGDAPRLGHAVDLGLVDVPGEQRRDVLQWDPLLDGPLGIVGAPRSGRSSALAQVVTGLWSSFQIVPTHVHVIEGVPGPLSRLRALPHVGSVTGAAEPDLVRRVLARLTEQLDTGATGPRTVLVIDGLEAVEDALSDVEHGAALDDLHRLVRDGAARGVGVVLAGGRALLSGRMSGLLGRRLVLDVADPLDLTLAGLDASVARSRRPPGRAVDAQTGLEAQLVLPDDDVLARAWPPLSPADAPWTVRPLPGTVPPDSLPSVPGALVVGVGGDDASPLVVDRSRAPRRLLVTGPARSGRSRLLAALALQLVADGASVLAVAPPRSPLRALVAGTSCTVVDIGGTEDFIRTRREDPDLCIVVDDVERLDGTPLGDAVLEALALLDGTDGVVIASADVSRAASAFRGLVPELLRDAHGVVLGARGPSDGEVFGVRLPGPFGRRTGRGFHVEAGLVTPVQVVQAGQPAPSCVSVGA